MRIKISLVSLLLAFCAFSFAQEGKTYSEVAGCKTAFKPNSTGSNWFIQLGAGGQAFVGENFSKLEMGDVISGVTLMPSFAIGRWWSPYWGFRLKGQGGSLHSFPAGNTTFMQKDMYYNGHLDAMWNMSQYFGKYNAKRVFNFIPYAGLGAYWRAEGEADNNPMRHLGGSRVLQYYNDAQKGITVHGGLLLEFRLSDHVGFHVDLAGMLMTDDYLNRIVTGTRYEGIASASAGFTFNLGKSYFEVAEGMDYGLINDLNALINKLRAENEILSRRPEFCVECPKVEPVVPVSTGAVVYAPNVVYFRLNSFKVDANQQIGIYNTAQFLKANSNEKIKVVGYADKKTGTSAYNLKLSEQRAKAVAKELMSKYNIPSDRIVVEWKGSGEQPYTQNDWNRVVIMSAQ